MFRWTLPILLVAAPLAAQSAPTFNQNGLRLHNGMIWNRRIEFPNFGQAGGNLPGDCLWKILPGEALMTSSGTLNLSGLETALEDLDGSTPFDHPDLHIYRAMRDAKGRLIPDFNRNLVKISLGRTSLPKPATGKATGFWLLNWGLGAPIPLALSTPARNVDLALCLMAHPGEARADDDGVTFPLTAWENYARSPQGSFSGYHDAGRLQVGLADGTWSPGGTATPYPAGEAWLEAAFVEPLLQPWCSSALSQGGGPLEQDLGVGSTWTDLASGSGGPGLIGWRIESWQDASGPNNWAFLLLNLTRPTASFALPGLAQGIALDPRDPTLTLLAMLIRSRQVHKPQGYSSQFWDGIFATGRIQLPRQAHFVGTDLYVGALMVDLGQAAFTGATNTCALHLR